MTLGGFQLRTASPKAAVLLGKYWWTLGGFQLRTSSPEAAGRLVCRRCGHACFWSLSKYQSRMAVSYAKRAFLKKFKGVRLSAHFTLHVPGHAQASAAPRPHQPFCGGQSSP